MSAPDNPDDKETPRKTSNADQPENSASESEDASASAETQPFAARTEAPSEPGGTAEQPSEPDPAAIKTPPDDSSFAPARSKRGLKRALRAVAVLFVVCLIGGPALFAWCVSETFPTAGINVAPSGGSLACPEIAGHFKDCYLSEEIAISAPAAPEKTGIAELCCDFVVDRTLTITASYKDASGNVPRTLNADSNTLPLRDETRITGDPILFAGGEIPSRSITLSVEPVFSMPLLDQIEALMGMPTGISPAGLVAVISPQSAETFRSENTIPLTVGGTMVRISNGISVVQQLRVLAQTSASLLFPDVLSGGRNAEQILSDHSAFPGSGDWLMRIDSIGMSDAVGIQAAYDALWSQSVAREETSEGRRRATATAALHHLLWRSAANFNRFDAAIATYLTARTTGLLTAVSPADWHGCKDLMPRAFPGS